METPPYITGNPKLGGKKKINKQIKKAYKQLNKQEKQGNRMINYIASGRGEALFNEKAEERAPLDEQIERATSAFTDIEDPNVRSQLIRSAEQSLRQNRRNELAQADQAVGTALNAKFNLIGAKQNKLNTLLGERQFSRGMASQNYLDKSARRNALQSMIEQKDAGLEFFGDAAGQYFLRTGQTSPAESSPWDTVSGPDGGFWRTNEQTGEAEPIVDPETGERVREKSAAEQLAELLQSTKKKK